MPSPSPSPLPAASSARDTARRCIEVQRRALDKLFDSVSPTFSHVVDELKTLKGRIIVTGMGKSGHIGRKIAATLSSTGTAAYFLHPAEASHGDLGCIASQDGVLALSNSGETAELADVVAYTKRRNLLLIAMTAKKNSSLARQADHVLLLPQVEEACPLGLAPTSSTTIALVYGDALAVALLEARNFTPHEFRTFHPGGKLGSKLTRVADIMHRGDAVPLVTKTSTMRTVLIEVTEKRLGCVGILDEGGKVVGIVTDGDVRRWLSQSEGEGEREADLQAPAASVMTHGVRTIEGEALVEEAITTMNAQSISSLFVLDSDHRAEGIVHMHDCLRIG